MPAIFTHVQFGKEVLATLPDELSSLAEKHPECFYLGTQGPDLLFYHKPLKTKNNPARKKGWDLHAESPTQFFLNGARILAQDKSNYDGEGNFRPVSAEAAYLLGFLCHFTLDYSCHPYIDEHSVDGLSHGKIESELDKYQYRKLGKPIRGFNAAKLFFPTKESQAASAKILGVSEKNTKTALKYMRSLNGLFSNKCGLVHGFCHCILTLVGMNKKFGDMFIHKKDDERFTPLKETLNEKFNGAISTATAVIPEFFEHIQDNNNLTNEIFRYNYSGIREI